MTNRADGSTTGRLDYLDNLRISLTILVVCHHQAIALGAPGGWYYVLPISTGSISFVVLTLFVITNQAFFMSLFFLVSAYFSPPSLDKKGARQFILDRVRRLGLPLLVYYFVLNPSLAYISFCFRGETESGYFTFMSTEAHKYFGWGPLWFVFALLLFTGTYLLVIRLSVLKPRYVPCPSNRHLLIFILIMGLVTFCVRLIWPLGTAFLGLQLPFFPLYIAFFVFGILAFRNGWFTQITTRQAKIWAAVTLVFIFLLPLMFAVGGASRGHGDDFRGGLTLQSLAYSVWEPFVCVGVSMGLITLFRHRINFSSPFSRMLSGAAYTVYIIHPFFVIPATYLVRNSDLAHVLLLALISPPVVAACFLISHFLRKLPPLNRVL